MSAPAIATPLARGATDRPSGMFTREELARETALFCDVVVVGSGAGGATMAAELAEGGLDVIVLEEGRYFQTADFNAHAAAMVRALYRDGGATMALGRPPVMFQEGRAVGGSTVINGGMAWRTPERILERWQSDDRLPGLGPDSLAPYFERVERRIHVRAQSPESVGRDNALLRSGAEARGWKVVVNQRNQLHCLGSNNCAFGCPTGAKQSALVSYIPRALHFGARVYSDVRATRILTNGKRAVGVEAHVIGADARPAGIVHVKAREVVVACGAVHTPALLARSGFRSPSGQLGRNLSLHPNCKVVAMFDEPVRGWEGVHQAYQVREFEDEGLVFAAVNIPPSILSMSLPMYGAELAEFLADYDRVLVAGMLCEDSTTGTVRTLGGAPQCFYQLSTDDFGRLVRGTALLCELLFEAGARYILPPFSGVGPLRSIDDVARLSPERIHREGAELLTVHLMGTARMSGDPARGVTDEFGRVYDADRLIVADASLFPSPIGVNPAETIHALATRNAHALLHRGIA